MDISVGRGGKSFQAEGLRSAKALRAVALLSLRNCKFRVAGMEGLMEKIVGVRFGN